ncbi:MAG TPA: histidinol-phosphate transaminase [Alphaproteobacteria bacterium]|nr:histidinol-phosphate transaminase [Alphaproteobacteria bacterium]
MKKTVLQFIPEHIRSLARYVPGKAIRQAQLESGVAMIKMASNENPFGPSPRALEAMRTTAAEANFYPDNEASHLRNELAERHKLAPGQVMVAAGSTALIDILARTMLGPGLNCVCSEKSFIIYPIAVRVAGGEFITAPMRGDAFDLDAIVAAINEQTRLVILSNPNNPTGTMFDADAADAFLRRVPENVLVVMDEAYSDFAGYFAARRGITYSRCIDHVRSGFPNLVVLRTFSKAHGLAGIRVGYAFGPEELLQHCARVRTAFSVSAMAEAAALAAIRDEAHIRKTVENNAAGAAMLMKGFQDMGIRAVPTSANFIYFDVEQDPATVARRMQDEGIIIRSLIPWGLPHGLRVSIGTPEQNEMFLRSLSKVVGQMVTK